MDLFKYFIHVNGVTLFLVLRLFLSPFFWVLVTAFLDPFLGAGADFAGSGILSGFHKSPMIVIVCQRAAYILPHIYRVGMQIRASREWVLIGWLSNVMD